MLETSTRWIRAHELWLVIFLIIITAALRLYQFPSVPAGLNQDEIAANYEAYSLLTNHTDRWGNVFPAYFSAWGSGQNVLYSYLSIPFVALFGMTPVSARIVAVLFGIAAVPLLYATVRIWFGRKVAFLATFTLALSPWHILLSRWGLESNLLPVFILMGVATFSAALKQKRQTGLKGGVVRIVSLLPFAGALYAYGISVVVIATLLPLFGLVYWKEIRKNLGQWLASFCLFLIASVPFILFLIKNYITHRALPFEHILPFSVPLLAESRLSQVSGASPIISNVQFIAHGFNDGQIWNVVPGVLPLALGVLVLAAMGIGYRLVRWVRRAERPSPFLLWGVACLPLFLLIPLNINQSNALYIPLIVCAADMVVVIANRLGGKRGALWIGVFALYLLIVAFYFASFYFSEKYTEAAKTNFNPDLSVMMPLARDEAAGQPLYVTDSLLLNYVQTLWYLKINPTEFQKYSPTFTDTQFANYYFSANTLPNHTSFTFLIRSTDTYPCQMPAIRHSTKDWIIGVCQE